MAVKLKALADPVRLQLLSAIASHAGGEACVCDISAGVEVSQPTVSHHLKVLRDAGLLTPQRRVLVGVLRGGARRTGQPGRATRRDAGGGAGMTDTSTAPPVVGKLSTLDRFPPALGSAPPWSPACCWAAGSPA